MMRGTEIIFLWPSKVGVCVDKSSNSEFIILESHRSLAKQDKLNKTIILKLFMVTDSVIQEEYCMSFF
jgi:hypothetical protein